MAFSEKIKEEVLKKSAFQCCVCQATMLEVEVHHITPQKNGGSDNIDNAAPLCPNCHSIYGNDPNKRKRIRQKRDWWYGRIENSSYPSDTQNPVILQNIYSAISGQRSDINELKDNLKTFAASAIDNMDPILTSISTNAVGSAISALCPIDSEREQYFKKIKEASKQALGEKCKHCGFSMEGAFIFCPNCGHKV